MGYKFNITITNDDTGEEEDLEASDHDEAMGLLAAHYAKALKEMELKAKDIQDEMADEEELINELK